MDIKITDIFNINITNPKKRFNKEYIVIDINSDYIDDYLDPINQYNGVYIYRLKKTGKLAQHFNKIGLNINNYIELGNYIVYDATNIKILLINKDTTQLTNRYSLLTTVGQLYIWKPLSMNGNYTNLGLVCTDDPHEVPDQFIGLVPRNHVKIFESSYAELFQNDYNLLGSNKDNKKKLLTTNILNEHNNDDNSVDSVDSTDTKNIPEQIEHFTDNNWEVFKTNNLVLVEANNPWYVNKENTIPQKYISSDKYFENDDNKKDYTHPYAYNKPQDSAQYVSNVKLDGSQPNLGLGYSFAERRNVENFGPSTKKDDNTNYIIMIMFFVIALLFLYNIYKKKKI
jgi:hypothetical protein